MADRNIDSFLDSNHSDDPLGLMRYLVETVQEQNKRLAEHEKRISQIEERLSQAERQISQRQAPTLWIYQPEFSLC